MTDNLVKRLRDLVNDDDTEMLAWEAADRIEELEASLRKSEYMSERRWDVLMAIHDVVFGRSPDISKLYWPSRVTDVQKRIEELEEALRLADAALSGANMNMDVVQKKVRAALGEKKDG